MEHSAARAAPLDGDAEAVGRRPIAIFVVVSLALLMSSIDSTVVSVALPTMMAGLKTNLVWIGWVITSYSLTQTIVLPMAGKLSDEFGRKRLFLGCVALFTLSSFLCAVAPNVYLLILFRVLQATGGGAFMPSAAGIVSDVFGARRRGTAIGLFTSVFPIGGLVGPALGGWVIDHFGWRAIFAVNLPLGAVLLGVGIFLLPASSRSHGGRGIDFVGVGAFAAGMLGLMSAMTVWGNDIRFSPPVVILALLGLAALIYFVRHEGRTRDPMIALRLLKERAFFAANLYNFLFGALVFGFFAFTPLYATLAYRMSATEAGFVLVPQAVAMIALSVLSSFLLIRVGYRLPMILGVVLISLGLFLLGQDWHTPVVLGHTVSNLALLAGLVAVTGLGVGIGGPAANNAAIELMPEAVARITGLRGMFRNTGGVLGTAMIVLILAHEPDQALGLAHVFRDLGILVLLIVPPIFLIPDTARARRRARRAQPSEVATAGAEAPGGR